MESLEVSAKNVEEAVDSALRKLGLNRSEVEIEVLREGKSGIFGWGGEEAKVRVTPLTSAPGQGREGSDATAEIGAIADAAKEAIENLLSRMDVSAKVQVIEGADDQSHLVIEITNGDLGILIGRRGQSLMALQYVVNLVASRKLGSNARVTIDVAGYRKRRQEELESLALRVADLVKSSRRAITLESMPASERRIIHITLKDVPEVTTGSIGFGDSRKVVVSPK
jgi:spoIIIJ-associated protein